MITDGLTPFTVLLFLAGVTGALALVATFVFGRLTQRAALQRLAARLFAAGTAIYVVVLLGVSIASSDRVLAPGESKHICEIDCHLAYSVVRTTSASLEQNRIRHIVTVQVVFDKTTISSGRPLDVTLSPNSRYVAVVDAQGRTYQGSSDNLRRQLLPGESYTTDLVFDTPADATDLRLILRSADPETVFLIGHENSLLHRKTTFRLEA